MIVKEREDVLSDCPARHADPPARFGPGPEDVVGRKKPTVVEPSVIRFPRGLLCRCMHTRHVTGSITVIDRHLKRRRKIGAFLVRFSRLRSSSRFLFPWSCSSSWIAPTRSGLRLMASATAFCFPGLYTTLGLKSASLAIQQPGLGVTLFRISILLRVA